MICHIQTTLLELAELYLQNKKQVYTPYDILRTANRIRKFSEHKGGPKKADTIRFHSDYLDVDDKLLR